MRPSQQGAVAGKGHDPDPLSQGLLGTGLVKSYDAVIDYPQRMMKLVPRAKLRLGTADFGPWEFQVWDMDLPGFDGFLGYDFFAKHVVCVDFPGKRIVIAN